MPKHDFELIAERHIAEFDTRALLYRHRTGARLLSLVNRDENKTFGATFRTPPADSTGVAHILEHAVLCGSRKYPVKEPFVELLKGSLKTFLNAFTYPDRTCYPVASQNVQDFYNLVDVYLDAVFHPRLTPQVLQQEGWHYELEGPEAPLTYKGVVYNEMKGANSSPDRVLAETVQQSLFPGHTYGVDSGGDPRHIPELSWEQFADFHRRFYHPANAWLYFCGDDDPDRRLELLAGYLDGFEPLALDSAVPEARRWNEPRRLEETYAVSEESASAEAPKSMVAVNWLLEGGLDAATLMGLQILEYILIGTPAAPLRKALIDSGLGEELTGTGMESELLQPFFSTGLKGVEVGREAAVEQLVLAELARLARDGIEAETVAAALNTTEFRLRENNTGSYPRGLVLMLRA
ncbi:MAG: insulinase family protein, partial [Gemmatimonadota bacterium]